MTDAQLIQASIAGDENAFKTLIQKYESMVAATVIGMIGPGQEAEDVGQDTFIRFYKSLKQFRGDSTVGTYITRIAMNLALNSIKNRKRRRLRFWQPLHDEMDIKDPDAKEYDGTSEMIHKAIQQLSPEFRAVIVLRFLKEHSIKEIAEIMQIPQGTVLSRLARGQKKLKIILQPLLGDENVKQEVQSAAQII
ncbi:RNA polymerase sigma factor [bacterium]